MLKLYYKLLGHFILTQMWMSIEAVILSIKRSSSTGRGNNKMHTVEYGSLWLEPVIRWMSGVLLSCPHNWLALCPSPQPSSFTLSDSSVFSLDMLSAAHTQAKGSQALLLIWPHWAIPHALLSLLPYFLLLFLPLTFSSLQLCKHPSHLWHSLSVTFQQLLPLDSFSSCYPFLGVFC